MQIKPPSSLCAGAAIAAALALGSTAGFAQDAALPDPQPQVPGTVPTIAAPAPAAPEPTRTMVQSPVVQPLPATPLAEPQPAQSETRAARPASRQAAPITTRPSVPAAVAAPAAAVPQVPAATPATQTVPVEPPPSPAAVAAPVTADARVSNDDGLTGTEAGIFALLAAAGLAGVGLVAMRARRRTRNEDVADTASPAEVAPVAAAAPASPREPRGLRPVVSPERFAMPSGPVPTGAERAALLERMIAAPPDGSNPFVSRKRRAQRARILLAQREQALRDRSTEPFDWRTYRPTGAKVERETGSPAEVADNTT